MKCFGWNNKNYEVSFSKVRNLLLDEDKAVNSVISLTQVNLVYLQVLWFWLVSKLEALYW